MVDCEAILARLRQVFKEEEDAMLAQLTEIEADVSYLDTKPWEREKDELDSVNHRIVEVSSELDALVGNTYSQGMLFTESVQKHLSSILPGANVQTTAKMAHSADTQIRLTSPKTQHTYCIMIDEKFNLVPFMSGKLTKVAAADERKLLFDISTSGFDGGMILQRFHNDQRGLVDEMVKQSPNLVTCGPQGLLPGLLMLFLRADIAPGGEGVGESVTDFVAWHKSARAVFEVLPIAKKYGELITGCKNARLALMNVVNLPLGSLSISERVALRGELDTLSDTSFIPLDSKKRKA